MKRDPFYQDLKKALDDPIDPDDFELAAVSLLKAIYPTLVPVHGGTDAGQDGAIADFEGRAFPLVVTTARDAKRNLVRSLTAYRERGGGRGGALFATARALTPTKRHELEAAAETLGFTLVQVHDQRDFIDLLYHRPDLCRSLLGLTPPVPGLSVVPISRRPHLALPVEGRAREMDLLQRVPGDVVLAGQPGSGKTAILRELTSQGWGYFAVSPDPGPVIEAIHRLQPARVIVDDAHEYSTLVRALVAHREKSRMPYAVVCTSWPGGVDEVASILPAGCTTIHLERLPQSSILEIVKSTGITGPPNLVAEILAQSEGKPGLAVTLAHLWLFADANGLDLADALGRDTRLWVRPIAGEFATLLLAALAVAGERGMALAAASKTLGISPADASMAASKLVLGGVLDESTAGRLSVHPPRLRQVLVRDELLSPGRREIFSALLQSVPGDIAAECVIGARVVGAKVERTLIEAALGAASEAALRAYASLGEFEALHAARLRPDAAVAMGESGLQRAPSEFLRLLLDAAVGDDRALHSHPDHPLRIIEDWARSPDCQTPVHRRVQLSRAAQRWYREGGDERIFAKAMEIALDPSIEGSMLQPGTNTVEVRFGSLTKESLAALEPIWNEWIAHIPALSAPSVRCMADALQSWIYGGGRGPDHDEEVRAYGKAVVRRLLHQIVDAVPRERRVILLPMKQVAENAGLDVDVPIADEVGILFPTDHVTDLDEWERRDQQAEVGAQQLAIRWASEEPAAVARLWVEIDKTVTATGRTFPRLSPRVATLIAGATPTPSEWLHALVELGAAPDIIAPFMVAAAGAGDAEAWQASFVRCLEQPALQGACVETFFRAELPERLRNAVVSVLPNFTQWLEAECLRGNVSSAKMDVLFASGQLPVQVATAVGWWHQDRANALRDRRWRQAILSTSGAKEFEYWLGMILSEDPSLAHDWLIRELQRTEVRCLTLEYEHPLNEAVKALDRVGRECILGRLNYHWGIEPVVEGIIDGEPELYRILLANSRLTELHLAPLQRRIDESWAVLAKIAIESGFSNREIVHAAWGGSASWSGEESDFWTGRKQQFDVIGQSGNHELVTLAEYAARYADARIEEARMREFEEDVRGL